MSDPEEDDPETQDAPVAAPSGPEPLATLGELLETAHIRFVKRVRERQRKGELE